MVYRMSLIQNLKYYNHLRKEFFRRIKLLLKIFYYSFFKISKLNKDIERTKSVIFLFNQKGIGDIIVFSPIFYSLKQKGIKVTLICDPGRKDLFQNLFDIDECLPIDCNLSVEEIKKLNLCADLIVDFGWWKHLIYSIKYIIAIKHSHALIVNRSSNKLRHFFDLNVPLVAVKHISELSVLILQKLSLSTDGKYHIKFPDINIKEVEKFITNVKNKKIVILNAKGSTKDRSFGYKLLEEICEFFVNKNDVILIIYNNSFSELEQKYSNYIFNPFSSFESSAYMIKFASLVITPDTSFVHVANYFNVKMVAFYNNRIENRRYIINDLWAPNYSNAKQIFTLDNLRRESGDDLRKYSDVSFLKSIEI